MREAVVDDAAKLRRRGRVQALETRRPIAERRCHDLLGRVAAERTARGEHLEENAAQREHVAARVGREASELLGRHVSERAENDPRQRARDCLGFAGCDRYERRVSREAEVENLGSVTGNEKDVLRLQVAMDDIFRMRGGQAVCDGCRDLDRRFPAKRSFDQPRAKRLSLEELHHREQHRLGDRELVNRDDRRVRQRRNRARLALEALPCLRVLRRPFGENLDGDMPFEPGVERAIDLAHAAGADRLENLILPKKRSRS